MIGEDRKRVIMLQIGEEPEDQTNVGAYAPPEGVRQNVVSALTVVMNLQDKEGRLFPKECLVKQDSVCRKFAAANNLRAEEWPEALSPRKLTVKSTRTAECGRTTRISF